MIGPPNFKFQFHATSYKLTMRFNLFPAALLLSMASAFVAPNRPAFSRSLPVLSVAIDTSDIKNGITVEIDGEPYKVLNFSIMKQARGAAKTTIKFKNLMRGNTIENTYRSGEKFETAMIEKTDAQFTYQEGVRTTYAVVIGSEVDERAAGQYKQNDGDLYN